MTASEGKPLSQRLREYVARPFHNRIDMDIIQGVESLEAECAEWKRVGNKDVKHRDEKIKALESALREADLQEKVRQFHLKFNFTANPVNEKPTLIPITLAMKRLKFLRSEVDELEEAEQLGDMVGIADALGDIAYFTYGNAVAYGIPLSKVFSEIHRSNMTKSPCLDKDGKATKGADYSPPDISGVLRHVSCTKADATMAELTESVDAVEKRIKEGDERMAQMDNILKELDDEDKKRKAILSKAGAEGETPK